MLDMNLIHCADRVLVAPVIKDGTYVDWMVLGPCPHCREKWPHGEFDAGLPKCEKPPLGVMPRKFWLERRYNELLAAIIRCHKAGRVAPSKWVDELSDLAYSLELAESES